jgi:hypothetical protein
MEVSDSVSVPTRRMHHFAQDAGQTVPRIRFFYSKAARISATGTTPTSVKDFWRV